MPRKSKKTNKELILTEKNFLPIKTIRSVPTNICLVYPNVYSLGMSNLGYHSMYFQINSRDDSLCHRAFLSLGKNNLTTIEAVQPLDVYDIVGFSISFEMDYINIFRLLETARIPVFSKDRQHPLIMAGGPAATFNPEPLAPFIDFFVIGEGEEVIHEIIEKYEEARHSDKQEILEELSQISGVYVPSLYDITYDKEGKVTKIKNKSVAPKPIKKRWIKDINKYNTESVVLTPYTEFKDMFLLEISRGCGRNCRFCMAGYCYRIPRYKSLNTVLERAEFGSKYKEKVGLVGAAVSDYPYIDRLAEQLVRRKIKFSVSSLRADTLREPLMEGLAYSGHRTLTIAPEAGSERLRKIINKGITEEHVINSINLAFRYGIINVKLYYIIGLPEETSDDINEMIGFIKDLKRYMQSIGNKRGALTVSINPFIPKPFTPFQWVGMEQVKILNKKIKLLQNQLKPKGIKVIFESPRLSQIQSALSRGDRQTGLLLYDIYKNGARTSTFKKAQIDGKGIYYYAHRILDHDEVLPWEHIDLGLKKSFFISEYNRALKGDFTTRCTDEKCRVCKICQHK